MSNDNGCREIITLQIGNYSNYVGTHWFNLQQQQVAETSDINPNVLWRQGLSPQRTIVWTPRILIFDLSNSINNLSSLTFNIPTDNAGAGKADDDELLWDGSVERITTESTSSHRTDVKDKSDESRLPIPQAERKPSASDRKVDRKRKPEGWLEFANWKLNTTSDVVFSIPNFSHNSSTGNVFNYDQGAIICKSLEQSIEDGIQRYVEECDNFEGYQLLVDENDGFGGLSSGILEFISDEYKKKSCLTLGLSPASSPSWTKESAVNFKLRIFNTALSWSTFNNHSSVFSSIGLCDDICKPRPKARELPFLNYKADSAYESSAVVAAFLDTLTSPYRLRSPTLMLNEVLGLLSGFGHKMTMFGSAFPFPLINPHDQQTKEESLFDTLSGNGLNTLHSMTPGIANVDPVKSIGNYFALRGVPDDRIFRIAERDHPKQELRYIHNAQKCLEMFAGETYDHSVNVVRTWGSPFHLTEPFPTHLINQGYLQTQRKSRFEMNDSWFFPAMASGHNSPQVGDMLEKLVNEAEIEKMKRNFNWGQTTVEEVDYIECVSDLRTLRESYNS